MNAMHKFRIFGFSILFLAGIAVQDHAKAQPGVSISFQTFYQELSPYGRWINSPRYGTVWTPYVSQYFQPYSTNGYWEMTDYGNTWVSEYEWGWAPFHYGRWSYDDYTGWFWVPGYEWGPAWVNWRSGGGYYGWAPLGPGISVNVSVNIPSFWWVFVPQRYMCVRDWHSYWVPRGRVNHIYNQTTIINNYYRNDNRTYVYGPRREELQRVTRRDIPVRQIDASRRGRVIIASNSRESDRYDSRDNSRSNSRIDASDSGYDRGSRERISSGRTENGRGDENDNYNRDTPAGRRGGNDDPNTSGTRINERSSRERSEYNAPENRSSRNGGYTPGSSPAQNEGYNRGNSDNGYSRQRVEPSERYNRRPEYNANPNGGRSSGNAPSVRSAPAERSSSPARGGESRSGDNASRSSRSSSERGGRSPR
ncbi:hypothetical protein DYBT9275_03817 [Dyadobacter sp. CECT 9275]|uniref:Uncharacterized protein n=1 Tax=Dyadobacter helix TaxID=2822344 RepID=A0A916JIA6_9BACT|nr:DUF6600 domain-containing protein [Dyadobacter sp. CECT 9275]CAG5006429.1 hypothetical protein DYBT9275_03817 [Dyadobacter sp. CECT 9275]